MNAVALRDVSVAHDGRMILRGVSFTVAHGERVALLGPNGAGKSSLLDVIVGIAEPAQGAVSVLGSTPPAAGVGFVPQQVAPSFLPWLSVRDNVLLPLRLRRAGARAELRALDATCARLDPARTLDLHAPRGALSAGQLQLAAVLRAFIADPRLVACDEPFSALDAATRVRVRSALVELCAREGGPALLLVTHDDEDVRALAQRTVTLTVPRADSQEPQPLMLAPAQVTP